MAKAKFGMVVTDMRGKLGGQVFTKNRGGAVVRTKVTPSNGQSPAQSTVRNRFTSLSQAWRGLTQAQRDAWNAAVINFQRTDVFGDLRSPSGLNLYQRLNNVLLSVGETAISTPPLPSEVANSYATAVSAAVATPALSVTLNATIPANTAVKLFATAPMSAGREFVKSQFRLIDILDAAATSPVNALAAYVAKFGNTGEIGQKIFVKTVPVNITTGQEGSPAVVSVITVA